METLYLMKNKKNTEQLLKAVEDFKNNINFKPVEICEEEISQSTKDKRDEEKNANKL